MAKNDPTTVDAVDEDATPTVEVATLDSEPQEHVVRPGEDWEQIAAQHGLDVAQLHDLNRHNPHFSDRAVTVNSAVRVR